MKSRPPLLLESPFQQGQQDKAVGQLKPRLWASKLKSELTFLYLPKVKVANKSKSACLGELRTLWKGPEKVLQAQVIALRRLALHRMAWSSLNTVCLSSHLALSLCPSHTLAKAFPCEAVP